MDKHQINGLASVQDQNGNDDDFELMIDIPKEDPVVIERRRIRNNEITKKLGAYLLKGYCMLSDACPTCDCILLRTPERQLLCVGCAEVDAAEKNKNETANGNSGEATGSDQRVLSAQSNSKKKDRVKRAKKRHKKSSIGEGGDNSFNNDGLAYTEQLESKLKWAVDELTKSHNPNRINAMCDVIIKLTTSIKALKDYELGNIQH